MSGFDSDPSGAMNTLDEKLFNDTAAGGTLEAQLNRLTQFLHGDGYDTGLGFSVPAWLTGESKKDALARGAKEMGVTPAVAGRLVKIYQKLLTRRKHHQRYKPAPQSPAPAQP